jgi:uncharacterized membrane protein YfcA
MIATIFVLSLFGGLCSGLLGVGGAVVLIPLMVSVPPLVGAGTLTMNQVAGLTMIQVLASAITGWVAHRRGGFTHTRTIFYIGIPLGICSLLGAVLSKFMPCEALTLVFGLVVLVALVLLIQSADARAKGNNDETPFHFHPWRFISTGAITGLASGILGAGGGFVLIPAMIRILKLPVRVAVGSSLGIIFIGALCGAVGKIVTLQVQWIYVPALLLGAIPASLLGSRLSHRLPAAHLRTLLMILIGIILFKTWAEILITFIR